MPTEKELLDWLDTHWLHFKSAEMECIHTKGSSLPLREAVAAVMVGEKRGAD